MRRDRRLTFDSSVVDSSVFDSSVVDSWTRQILTLAVAVAACIAVGFITAPAASAQSSESTMPATVMLTKIDVERFIATMPELSEIGLNIIDGSGADTTGVTQMTEAIASQDEAIGILEKHGFDVPEFRDVGYSVMMAYAAGELENSDVDVAAARDQFASLQGMIPEDQYQMLDQQIGNMQEAIESQPEANIELVREYKSQIAAATN
jgi:hypothetical protein